MQKIILKAIVISLLFAAVVSAEEKKSRVAYIDLEYVFDNSAARNTVFKEFKAQRSKILTAKKNAEEKVLNMRTELRALQAILGYEEYQKKIVLIKDRITEYENEVIEAKKEIKKWEEDLMASTFDDVLRVFEILAEENDVDIIVSKKTSVLYGKNDLDLTQQAVDLINEIDERNTPSAR